MAIIAFWSQETKETGQTLSQVALTTHMAIEHNYRILSISTTFKDTTMESCYWNLEKENAFLKNLTNTPQVGLESGVEGLIKVIKSNKTSTNIIANYAKIVFKDRLDILCAPKTKDYNEYSDIASSYPEILQIADRAYDLVFIDVSNRLPEEQSKRILEMADIIIVNMTQKLQIIDDFIKLKEENDFFKKNNILINIGRYDKFSKYNVKNITRYIKQKRDILVTPYNTLFFESCSEGKVAEFFLRLRRLDPDDRNAVFVAEESRTAKEIIYKMQELQIKV